LPTHGRNDDHDSDCRRKGHQHPEHDDVWADGAIDPGAVVARLLERVQVDWGGRNVAQFFELMLKFSYPCRR